MSEMIASKIRGRYIMNKVAPAFRDHHAIIATGKNRNRTADVQLEYGVDNITPDCSTSTEYCRIPQFLSELLSHLLPLARFVLSWLLRDLHWRNRTVIWVNRTWRRGAMLLISIATLLLITIGVAVRRWLRRRYWAALLSLNIVDWEHPLTASAKVFSVPPIVIHEFRNGNLVADLDL